MKPKVFISSTCYDLIDLRAELERELKDMGLSPILSDSITSEFEVLPTAHSIESCLHNVRNCDYYIIILSQRYGPSLKNVGFDDCSATELEYLEAKKLNKPIYMYVRDKFEIEYNMLTKSNNIDNLSYVSKKDAEKLFALYRNHKKLSADSTASNWFGVFKNCIDLKELVRRDLKLVSGKAIINRMVEKGNIPLITVTNAVASKIPNKQKLRIEITFQNFGNTPALNPHAFIEKCNPLDFLNVEINHSLKKWDVAKSLVAGEQTTTYFELEVDEQTLLSNNIFILCETDYVTPTGVKLSDVSYLAIFWKDEAIMRDSIKSTHCLPRYIRKSYIGEEGFQIKVRGNTPILELPETFK